MSEPMPLGPALVVGATIYIFLGDYFISFMNFQ
jgi:prepilin signal peptidase PulO-like enzyme (type II secretory pathway)